MIRLKELCAPDKHFVNAAKGWLELGLMEEARGELGRLHVWSQQHPEVLKLKWKLSARSKEWEESLRIAKKLSKMAPDQPSSWICLSFSLFNANHNQEAWSNLLQAAEKFPKVSAIPYFLARLSCKMGNMKEATRWITKWNKMVDKTSLRKTAENDPALEPLWQHMKQFQLIPETESPQARESTNPLG